MLPLSLLVLVSGYMIDPSGNYEGTSQDQSPFPPLGYFWSVSPKSRKVGMIDYCVGKSHKKLVTLILLTHRYAFCEGVSILYRNNGKKKIIVDSESL